MTFFSLAILLFSGEYSYATELRLSVLALCRVTSEKIERGSESNFLVREAFFRP